MEGLALDIKSMEFAGVLEIMELDISDNRLFLPSYRHRVRHTGGASSVDTSSITLRCSQYKTK